jgi:hypothetical protein
MATVHYKKQHGVYYTPPPLCDFLARAALQYASPIARTIRVLDPACGDGRLLEAVCRCLPPESLRHIELIGLERDDSELGKAERRLCDLAVSKRTLHCGDFLQFAANDNGHSSLQNQSRCPTLRADVIVSNPPYVRTQRLGAAKARQLAERFGLSGRLDLYQAFTIAMTESLVPGGILGLLTSNRFFTTEAGRGLRAFLQSRFVLRGIYDLGDTQLFRAAVLPAIVIGTRKTNRAEPGPCAFVRVYRCRQNASQIVDVEPPAILDAVASASTTGRVQAREGQFVIARGNLEFVDGPSTWTLSTPVLTAWLDTINRHRAASFRDVAHIRVGVKTTADDVFIRQDWDNLPATHRPEKELLFPLITHHAAARWTNENRPWRTILYPHCVRDGKRAAVNLSAYKRASAYLRSHRTRLESRAYVAAAGREWFEIWVTQNPADWAKPKIIFPDIAEFPRFWLDTTGAIVNGDCYWMTLRDGMDAEWLQLILAVANSTFAIRYYDTLFHNKLYAGRRRFMTQYVNQFPLPNFYSPTARQIILQVNEILSTGPTEAREREIDRLVWESFGLVDTGDLESK